MKTLRSDLAPICEWITPRARILDLGCGDGMLLAWLAQHREVRGYGVEIDPAKVAACISAGVNVLHMDIDDGLGDFATRSFDFVVMNLALQALQRPDLTIAEILRVGRTAIVTFPNFGHWRARLDLLRGRMPMTEALHDQWYDTPNIHLCTVADFEQLCAQRGWRVLQRRLLDVSHEEGLLNRIAPNLFTEIALYMLQAPAPQTELR